MSESIDSPASPATPPRRRGGLRFGLVLAGALIGGGIGGTGAFALAQGGPWHGGWHRGHRLERLQAMVSHALDGVGATSAQEARIHDIMATSFAGMGEEHADHEAMRKQMLDLLRAPTVDRAAAEKLRADAVARFDARSKTVTGAVLEAADQLSPAQRAALADRIEERMARRMEGGRGMDGGPRGHRRDGGADRPGPGEGGGDEPNKG